MQTTIIPPAPSAEELAAEREAAAISRTGALIIAARYAGRTLSTRSNLRQAIPAHRDSNAPTVRP